MPSAENKTSKSPDPFTPEMREAYQQIHKIHNGMDKITINAAVDRLFQEIKIHNPKVFVPMVLEDIMRLAPKDKRTISLLYQCLQEGWLTPTCVHSCLARAGEPPKEHIDYLILQLDNKNRMQRIAAISAIGMCGAKAKDALPRLEKIVQQSNAPPEDYVRDYTSTLTMPEHVHAKNAINRIKQDLQTTSQEESDDVRDNARGT